MIYAWRKLLTSTLLYLDFYLKICKIRSTKSFKINVLEYRWGRNSHPMFRKQQNIEVL